MRARLTRAAAPALLPCLLAVATLGRAGPAEPAAGPLTTASESAGSLSISNSRGANAILSVTGLAPGRSTAGEVTITNAGSLAGALTVETDELAETPGLGGGLLSQRLELVVLEHGASVVYQGPYGAFGRRALGLIGPGQARRYRFTATLPDAGVPPSATTGDNAYQGASLTSAFRWTASASQPSEGGSQPSGGGPQSGGTAPGSKLVLGVRLVKRQPSLRRRRIVIYARCNRACALAAHTRMRGRKGRSKQARRPTVRPSQRVKLTLRLTRRSARRLARAVARRRRARLSLSVKARDAEGGRAAFVRGIELVQVRRGGRRLIVARWTKARRPVRRRSERRRAAAGMRIG